MNLIFISWELSFCWQIASELLNMVIHFYFDMNKYPYAQRYPQGKYQASHSFWKTLYTRLSRQDSYVPSASIPKWVYSSILYIVFIYIYIYLYKLWFASTQLRLSLIFVMMFYSETRNETMKIVRHLHRSHWSGSTKINSGEASTTRTHLRFQSLVSPGIGNGGNRIDSCRICEPTRGTRVLTGGWSCKLKFRDVHFRWRDFNKEVGLN